MSQKFKLAISNHVDFEVKFALSDDKGERTHKFFIQAERLTEEEVNKRLKADPEQLLSHFMRPLVTGWRGQQLVLDESDQPAAFSPEAFDAMISIDGVGPHIYRCYRKAIEAKGKN